MYVIEVLVRFIPLPLSVQRKSLRDAQILYDQINRSMDKGNPKLIELTCESVVDKKITVVSEQILAVQVYEKTASPTGGKRPGFSFSD